MLVHSISHATPGRSCKSCHNMLTEPFQPRPDLDTSASTPYLNRLSSLPILPSSDVHVPLLDYGCSESLFLPVSVSFYIVLRIWRTGL